MTTFTGVEGALNGVGCSEGCRPGERVWTAPYLEILFDLLIM